MKAKWTTLKDFVFRNKWIILGILLVTVYVFSNYAVGLKMSFTNVNYSFAPFASTDIATEGPLLSDIADNHYPSTVKHFYTDERFSLWESDIALGRSTSVVAEYMNPLNWVYFCPFELAIFLKAFSEFLIGFIGMFLFMRSLGVQKFSASMAGIVYTFSASIVVWLGWSHSDVAVLAPFLFFAIEKLIETIRVRYLFIIALVIYLMLIVGMPTYAAYFMYLAGLYIVIFAVKRHWQYKRNIFVIGGMFAVAVILAALVSLPYTFTLLESAVGNGYIGSRTAYGEAKLGWGYLQTILFPYERDGMNIHMNESTLFIGAIAVVVLPFAVCNVKNKKRAIFFFTSTIVLVLLIFTDALNAFYTKLPMINTSLKYRVIVLLMFTMASLTGITLNDFFVNKEYYRKKQWLLAVGIQWINGILLLIGMDLFEPRTKLVFAMGLLMLAMVICIAVLIAKEVKIVYALLAVLVTLNSVTLVKGYLPWIDADVETVPQPTQTVTYLMENTTEEQRVAGVGDWTLFPNTSSYYNLNDIRTHGFEATNLDMKTYYKMIDDESYLTSTRTALRTIDNYELLKALGVKYIYGEKIGNMVPVSGDASHSKAYGKVAPNSELTQNITLTGTPELLSVLFATYGTTPQSEAEVTLSLTSAQSGQTVFTKSFPITRVTDNSYITLLVDAETPIAAGDYVFKLAFGDFKNDVITVWMKEQEGSVVNGSNGEVPGAIAMFSSYANEDYRVVYSGNDGLMAAEMTEYADKVELVETLNVFGTEEQVLEAMAADYVDNAGYLVGDEKTGGYDRPLEKGEGIIDVDYSDNKIIIHCNSATERYLVLNDYYDEEWVAYVNGAETPIEKINYLMRGVKIDAGKDIVVEFRYVPKTLYIMMGVSGGVMVLIAVLFVLRRKLQGLVNKITIKEDIHA